MFSCMEFVIDRRPNDDWPGAQFRALYPPPIYSETYNRLLSLKAVWYAANVSIEWPTNEFALS